MKKILLIAIVVIVAFIGAGTYLDKTPSSQNAATNNVPLSQYGSAPDFTGIDHWLNSQPLTLADLKGKVVLVDFWTYSCINCIRTLPSVTGWYEKYKDDGFVVVGVHTPEFAFEKDTKNVQTALTRFDINYPVAQDNNYKTWSAYNNHYWPAHYLIDKNGNVVYTHFGEGNYKETEQAIQKLLGLNDKKEMDEPLAHNDVQSPEMYFGLSRLQNISPEQNPSTKLQNYDLPAKQVLNTFSLNGSWAFNNDNIQLVDAEGTIRLRYHSKDVHIVAHSDTTARVTILIDGVKTKTIDINDSSLYTLVEGKKSGEHLLELQIRGKGFEAFTFTFG